MNKFVNYHTHTPRCHHAEGAEEEYVQAAIANGFSTLGFSDHGAWPFANGFRSRMRMTVQERAGYEQTVRELAQRYKGQINIRLGYEYEYFPKYLPYLREVRAQVDYLLLGNHYELDEPSGDYFGAATTAREIRRYVECTIAGMETGLYDCLAHPDLFLNEYPAWDGAAERASRMLCQAAARLRLPLEYNLYGVDKRRRHQSAGLGYPCDAFWRVAVQSDCDVVIGCDAHIPAMLSR
ncbi:MAG: histidinol-phosphatase, partial [Clostridia bacterium]